MKPIQILEHRWKESFLPTKFALIMKCDWCHGKDDNRYPDMVGKTVQILNVKNNFANVLLNGVEYKINLFYLRPLSSVLKLLIEFLEINRKPIEIDYKSELFTYTNNIQIVEGFINNKWYEGIRKNKEKICTKKLWSKLY